MGIDIFILQTCLPLRLPYRIAPSYLIGPNGSRPLWAVSAIRHGFPAVPLASRPPETACGRQRNQPIRVGPGSTAESMLMPLFRILLRSLYGRSCHYPPPRAHVAGGFDSRDIFFSLLVIFFVVGCPRNASNSSINSHLACLSPLSSPNP